MFRDVHTEAAESLLVSMRKDKVVIYTDLHQDALAEKLSVRILKPWFWSAVDVRRKVNAIWLKNQEHYKKKKLNEAKAKKTIEESIVEDIQSSAIGVFFVQKKISSISSDLVDFLFESDEIEDIFSSNEEIESYFETFLQQYK